MWNEFFKDLARRCCLPVEYPLLCSIFQSFIGLWVDIETNPHVPIRILCKAADLNQQPIREKGICSDSNWTQQCQMAECESLKTVSSLILNQSEPSFAARTIANDMWFLQSHLETSIDRTSSNFEVQDFWAACLYKQLSTVLLTNHPLLDLEDLLWNQT